MPITYDEIRDVFLPLGFTVEDTTDPISDTPCIKVTKQTTKKLYLVVHVPARWAAEQPVRIGLEVSPMAALVGQVHEFKTVSALHRDAAEVVAALDRLVLDPAPVSCLCGDWMVERERKDKSGTFLGCRSWSSKSDHSKPLSIPPIKKHD